MSSSVRLNNAIAALGHQNRGVAKVDTLAKDWVSWFESVRPWLPVKLEFAAAYYYWLRYKDAHDNHAKVTGGKIPTPEVVRPGFTTMVAEDLAWREQAIKDTGRAAAQAAEKAVEAVKESVQSGVGRSLIPVAVGAAALGFMVLATRSRARRVLDEI